MATNKYGLATTRGGVAWALHEWHTAFRTVGASADAEVYACAADLVVEYLRDRDTFAELLTAFFYPEPPLTQLIAELCAEGEIFLQPHVLIGAACALRLRQLLQERRSPS